MEGDDSMPIDVEILGPGPGAPEIDPGAPIADLTQDISLGDVEVSGTADDSGCIDVARVRSR